MFVDVCWRLAGCDLRLVFSLVTWANDYEWPDGLPDSCPPPDADPAGMTVYRFVKSDPPASADFARPIDNPNRKRPPGEDTCDLCALSVFASEADISTARAYIPGFKKRLVAVADIKDEHGVTKRDPIDQIDWPKMESHHNWWVPTGVDVKLLFQGTSL